MKEFYQHYSGLTVSSDGEVFVPKSGTVPAHYTYGCKNTEGYRRVKYKRQYYLVHRLVAECYIPNPDGKREVDHINTNRSDNRVENLRWCTHGENQNNPLSRQKMSEAQCENKKPVIGINKETGITVEFESAMDAMYTLNIAQSSICSCCQGNRKSAGGYIWRYA